MKKQAILILALFLSIFATSCEKEIFEPIVERTNNTITEGKQITGTWLATEYKVNGVDLFKDSLEVDYISQPNSRIRTRFESASLVFEEDGSFTEQITYGSAIHTIDQGQIQYTVIPTHTELGKGTVIDLDGRIVLNFDLDSSTDPANNNLFHQSSPMNSPFITGRDHNYSNEESYSIVSMTRKAMTIEGVINGKTVHIKLVKQI